MKSQWKEVGNRTRAIWYNEWHKWNQPSIGNSFFMSMCALHYNTCCVCITITTKKDFESKSNGNDVIDIKFNPTV